jgi:transposase
MNVKRYSEEYKRSAVELAEKMGSISGASRSLGISDANIHLWRKKYGSTVFPLGANTKKEEMQEEILRLRKENEKLKKINEILKGAAAFFSQDHLK